MTALYVELRHKLLGYLELASNRSERISLRSMEMRSGVERKEALQHEDGPLDLMHLIVLREALRTARCTRFDLSSAQSHSQVSNVVVLSFSGTVGSHYTPPALLRKLHRRD